jgi:hypothetical protein
VEAVVGPPRRLQTGRFPEGILPVSRITVEEESAFRSNDNPEIARDLLEFGNAAPIVLSSGDILA